MDVDGDFLLGDPHIGYDPSFDSMHLLDFDPLLEQSSLDLNFLDSPLNADDKFADHLLDGLNTIEEEQMIEDEHSYAQSLSPRSGNDSLGSSSPTNTSSGSEASYPLDILDAASQEIFEQSTETSFDFDNEQPQQYVQEQKITSNKDNTRNGTYQYRAVSQQRSEGGQRPTTTSTTTTQRFVSTATHSHARPTPLIKLKPVLRGNPATISLTSQGNKQISSSGALLKGSVGGSERSRKFAPLSLSEEEKRLCQKENINLPPCYPLTKTQERDLKRIRRKIRNKNSAQNSRKKKQKYIEELEDRLAYNSQENHELKQQVDILTRKHESIMAQLRELQQVIAQKSRRSAQAGTCLAVLVLSMCLLVAPHLNPFMKRDERSAMESEEASRAMARQSPHNLSLVQMQKHTGHVRSRTLMDLVGETPGQCVGVEKSAHGAAPAAVAQAPIVRKRPAAIKNHRVHHISDPPNLEASVSLEYGHSPPPTRLVNSTNKLNYMRGNQQHHRIYASQAPPMAKRMKVEPL